MVSCVCIGVKRVNIVPQRSRLFTGRLSSYARGGTSSTIQQFTSATLHNYSHLKRLSENCKRVAVELSSTENCVVPKMFCFSFFKIWSFIARGNFKQIHIKTGHIRPKLVLCRFSSILGTVASFGNCIISCCHVGAAAWKAITHRVLIIIFECFLLCGMSATVDRKFVFESNLFDTFYFVACALVVLRPCTNSLSCSHGRRKDFFQGRGSSGKILFYQLRN